MHRARAALAGGAVTLLSAILLSPATAATTPTASAGAGGAVRHFNVGAAHSPQLQRLLAGRAALSPGQSRARAATAASTPAVQGIDLASEQHLGGATINWSDVASAGYKFAFIKVSEGSYYVNPYYAGDAAGAQAAGMFVAPYAFAIPNYSGGTYQADYALDSARYAPDGKILPLILDIEYDPYAGRDGTPSGSVCYGLTPAQMVAWIHAFAAETHRRTGQLPIIYTTAQWWKKCTASSTAFTADQLWIAGDNSAGTAPAMPAGWKTWTYWQYTSSAKLAGAIKGDFDASYLSSSALELAAPASQSDQAGSTPASLTASALDGSKTGPSYGASGLPSGMSIDPASGVVSGTLPATPGTTDVSVSATAGTLSAAQTFTWAVHGKVTLGKLPVRQGSVGTPVRWQVPASDALPGCTLRFTASGLPPGLSMSSCGLVSGWLQTSGQYTAKIRVTDSSDALLAQGTLRWKVNPASGRGPAGQIRLVRDGKCLAVLSRTDIAIETCKPGKAQQWTIAPNGSVRHGGECLTAARARGPAPAGLGLAPCASGGQRWQQRSDAELANLTDRRCMADTGTKSGSRAVAEGCYLTPNSTGSAATPGRNQQWTLPAGPLTSEIGGLCASDWHRAGVRFGSVTLHGCDGTAQQAWTIEPDGSVRVGGDCLGLNGGKTMPGTAVWLGSCRHAPTQVWQLSGGPIGVQLFSPATGLCLADPGDRASYGAQLAIDPCVAGDPGISWRVS